MCYLTYIFAMICTVDSITVNYYLQWVSSLDNARLAIGFSSIIRILIVTAKERTMVMNAGFFSYILFNTNY